jgi:hypothetical protein
MPRSNKGKKSNGRKGKSVMKNDQPMFNDNLDSDYSNASEAMEAVESLQVQVRLRLEELQLFKGTQVEIVRFGDDISNPLVSGLVSLVDTTPSQWFHYYRPHGKIGTRHDRDFNFFHGFCKPLSFMS